MYTSILLACLPAAFGLPSPLHKHESNAAPLVARSLPFSSIVAFGDSMTDNGNGSYAHCTQAAVGDCSNKIYAHKTWTNGPVAVSYLANMLGTPLTRDYGWGWNRGAGTGIKMAAQIKHSFDDELSLAQDGFQQVHNYTSSLKKGQDISQTLHFLWIGNMDITFPKFQYPVNTLWSNEMATMMSQLVGELVNKGAKHVFVPGLYPKNLAPFHTFMASLPQQQIDMGTAIQQANTIIKKKLKAQYGAKVTFYDVYGRMTDLWDNHAKYGITKVGTNFCDGDSVHPKNFAECLVPGKEGAQFFWINYTDPTTRVHELVAEDMHAYIMKTLGAS